MYINLKLILTFSDLGRQIRDLKQLLRDRMFALVPEYPFSLDYGRLSVAAFHAYYMALPDPELFYYSVAMLHKNNRIRVLSRRVIPCYSRNYHHAMQLLAIIQRVISRARITRSDHTRVVDILRRREESIGRRIDNYNQLVRGSRESLYESSDSEWDDSDENNGNLPRLYHRQPNSPTFSEATTQFDGSSGSNNDDFNYYYATDSDSEMSNNDELESDYNSESGHGNN